MTHSFWVTYRVSVPIVVLYNTLQDLGHLTVGLDAAEQAEKFFLDNARVRLQTTVGGYNVYPANGGDYIGPAPLLHRHEFNGAHFLSLILSEAARFGPGYLGLSLGGKLPGNSGGFCLVAGNNPVPGGGSLVDEILVHELGHLFGLGHEDGTFMRATLETENRVVTKEQRSKIRETAYIFGGL